MQLCATVFYIPIDLPKNYYIMVEAEYENKRKGTKLMKNFIKRITALLCLPALFCCFPAAASAGKNGTADGTLRFNADGKFNIMHVTDTHLSMDNLDDTVYLIAAACDREQPDIVVLTGDIAMADTLEEIYQKTDALMNIFETRGIPVAVCFGNHDSENGVISREDLMAHYNGFSCSVSVDEGELLPGCGTYNVPVLSSKDDTVKFNLWVFDSGAYDGEGHYANVLEEQVAWYVAQSKALENSNGEKVNSLVFQHIIVPEVYDALKEVKLHGAYTYPHIYDTTRYFAFDPARENHGMLHEYPCPGYYNHGQFEAMVQRGDVLAMFTGHDHSNAFSVKYEGIDIVNSLSTRYNGDLYSTKYGYRMITVDENDTSAYETKVVHWYDFFDASAVGADCGNNAKLVSKVRFLGFVQKLATKIAVFFAEAFSGRTVVYPD